MIIKLPNRKLTALSRLLPERLWEDVGQVMPLVRCIKYLDPYSIKHRKTYHKFSKLLFTRLAKFTSTVWFTILNVVQQGSNLAKANIVAYNKHPLIQPTYSQHHTSCPLGTIKQNVWFNSSNLAIKQILLHTTTIHWYNIHTVSTIHLVHWELLIRMWVRHQLIRGRVCEGRQDKEARHDPSLRQHRYGTFLLVNNTDTHFNGTGVLLLGDVRAIMSPGVALDILHRAMPHVLLHRLCVAIEMDCNGGSFVCHHHLFSLT